MSKYISDVIKRLAEEQGKSQAAIAKATGVSRSAVSKWFSGMSQPSRDVIPYLSVFFGVPVSTFYELDASERMLVDYPLIDYPDEEPVHDVAAGQGRIASQPESYSEEGQLARVVGDSMYPSLHDGDVVRFVEAVDVEPSDFALVRINGDELTCKHIEWSSDGLWIRAENTDVFQDRFYTVREISTIPVQIVGKAVEVRRKL